MPAGTRDLLGFLGTSLTWTSGDSIEVNGVETLIDGAGCDGGGEDSRELASEDGNVSSTCRNAALMKSRWVCDACKFVSTSECSSDCYTSVRLAKIEHEGEPTGSEVSSSCEYKSHAA